MRNRDFMDIGRLMEEAFSAAEDLTSVFAERMNFDPRGKGFNWDAAKDFYPFYSYPPANIYMLDDRTQVFEFALAGFREEDINLEFKGDYMVLSASVPEGTEPETGAHFLKRRLKFKDIKGQEYYVPEDKFNRDATKATFRNGILKVTIPPKEEVKEKAGVKITIESDAEESK